MFCPNCGNDLVISGQNFCHNCRFEIPEILNHPEQPGPPKQRSELPKQRLEPPQQRPVKYRYESRLYSKPEEDLDYYYIKRSKRSKTGKPGPYSKKCLGYSIVSCAIAAVTLFLGYGMIIYRGMYSILSYPSSYYSSNYSVQIISIVIVISRFIGLALGIFAKANSRLAEKHEPINTADKIGSVFSIFGIVLNGIGLVLSIIMAFIYFMPSTYTYSYY